MFTTEGLLALLAALACVSPYAGQRLGRAWLVVCALGPAIAFTWGLTQIGVYPTSSYPWLPSLGIDLSFALTPWSLFFWLVITGMGTGVFLYAASYMKKEHGRLAGLLCAFTAVMLGLVSAGDLVTLFMFWEGTSVVSFLLIGFKRDSADARRSARQAFAVTGFGGLIMLAGFLLLAHENGSFLISQLQTASPLAIGLIAVGCLAKSAQQPFSFWLPDAMSAPTPVSAFLHSATMVKAGVYLLGKLAIVFGPQPVLQWIGGLTLLLGAAYSVRELDLKRVLAWTTVSALGLMVLLAGVATPVAFEALVVTVFAHALYKGCLFMVAGAVDLTLGSRMVGDVVGKLSHWRMMQVVGILAATSMMGLPLLAVGFVMKEAVLAALTTPHKVMMVAAAACWTVAAFTVGVRPFWRRRQDAAFTEEPPVFDPWLAIVPLVLGIGGAIAGITVAVLDQRFFNAVAADLAGAPVTSHIALWHGFTLDFGLSVVAVVAGLGATVFFGVLKSAPVPTRHLSFQSSWTKLYRAVLSFGRAVSRVVTNNSVRQHTLWSFVTFVGLAGWTFYKNPLESFPQPKLDMRLNELMILGFAMIAAIAVTRAKTRIGGVAVLGVVGVSMTLTYIIFSAPDLALTQLLIEVLSVVLFVLIFSRLPRFATVSSRLGRIVDMAVALSMGLTMAWIVYRVTIIPQPSMVSTYFAENAYVKAKGHNVVNTIIVDFRGLDTMGELCVLCVAALGVHTLIRFRPMRKEKSL